MANAVIAQIGARGRIVRLEALCTVGGVLAARSAVGGVARIISVARAVVARTVIPRIVAVVVTVTAVVTAGSDCAARESSGRDAVTGPPIATVPSTRIVPAAGTGNTADGPYASDTTDATDAPYTSDTTDAPYTSDTTDAPYASDTTDAAYTSDTTDAAAAAAAAATA
jgi:hypothetical protein